MTEVLTDQSGVEAARFVSYDFKTPGGAEYHLSDGPADIESVVKEAELGAGLLLGLLAEIPAQMNRRCIARCRARIADIRQNSLDA